MIFLIKAMFQFFLVSCDYPELETTQRGVNNCLAICLYRKNAIAIQNESSDCNGGN